MVVAVYVCELSMCIYAYSMQEYLGPSWTTASRKGVDRNSNNRQQAQRESIATGIAAKQVASFLTAFMG